MSSFARPPTDPTKPAAPGQPHGLPTPPPAVVPGVPGAAPPAAPEVEVEEETSIFALRTFDRHWVDSRSLEHFVQWIKIPDPNNPGKYIRWAKRLSDVPLILRDMGPPDGSIFDPKKTWEAEKDHFFAREHAKANPEAEKEDAPVELTKAQKKKLADDAKKAKKAEKAAKSGKLSAKDIIAKNNKAMAQNVHKVDIERMQNNNNIDALLKAKVQTVTGKLQRMLKMLDIAVRAKEHGKSGSSEEEVLDILWALEEMDIFKSADEEIAKEKLEKKARKKNEKEKKDKKEKDKKDKKKDKKGGDGEDNAVALSDNAKILKSFYDDKSLSYKDSLKTARSWMKNHKSDIIRFQMLKMHDRLPPLSRYNRKFKLEEWQCRVLAAIDKEQSTVVCAPTSSGKTLLSTYTCAKERKNRKGKTGTVLFVLPSEVLVWQIAATYAKFFSGNVTICTESITFQEIGADFSAQITVGTPRALELALTKARGCAGQEMMAKPQRESVVLDGGFDFQYMVLDEVHTLNGPEGDSLQRIIRATRCPILALSATIGNAVQLRDWFQEVRNEHIDVIDGSSGVSEESENEVLLAEHFARFINLQRYVVKEENTLVKGMPVKSYKMVKLHPTAAMTASRLAGDADLVKALSMTPVDMMNLWDKLEKFFPGELKAEDSPDEFFSRTAIESLAVSEGGDESADKVPPIKKRITLPQTKEYENRLKEILAQLAVSNPDKYEELRASFDPPPLEKIDSLDITDQLYGVMMELKERKLLPAVAFQLSTFGAFQMFKTLLKSLEHAQNLKYPNHRRELKKKAAIALAFKKEAEGKGDRSNAKEDEEDAKDGLADDAPTTEDIYQPHPEFVLAPPGSGVLNSKEIDDVRSAMDKAGEKVDINHALIRGLRRGIAIYTNEVGFACYRRQVQILAQQGKLAVVFSDEALAYGVNMPFRSCVFCGDMGTALTPLIAQQMQGRAGRRGMDVQGNIVYLGMDWATIENLMLGQISQVTGKNPHYPLVALQRALAASNDPRDPNFIHGREVDLDGMSTEERANHKKWAKMSQAFENSCFVAERWQNRVPTLDEDGIKQITNRTLSQFCGIEGVEDYYNVSKETIRQLGYIELADDDFGMPLAMDHNVLSMVWELSLEYCAESVNLVHCLETLYSHFITNNRRSHKNEGDQNAFMACILQIVDRVECPEGVESMQRYLKAEVEEGKGKMVNERAAELITDIEQDLKMFKDKVGTFSIPESEKTRLFLPLVGGGSGPLGVPLDSGVYEILQTKRKTFPDSVPVSRRNDLKNRLFSFGKILRIMNNNIQQPHGKFRELSGYTNKCFSAVRYSLTDMMTQLTNQPDEVNE